MTIQELAAQYGWLLAIVIWSAWKGIDILFLKARADIKKTEADVKDTETETQREAIVNSFAVDFNAERRVWEDRHHKLQEEFTTFRIENARKEGGLDILKEMLGQEREQLQKLEIRVQELEKRIKSDETRIHELEVERDSLLKEATELKATILLGEEAKRDLITQLEQQIHRADSLNGLVTQLREIDNKLSDKAQASPDKVWDEESEQTLILPPKTETTQAIPDISSTITSAATEAAEESKP